MTTNHDETIQRKNTFATSVEASLRLLDRKPDPSYLAEWKSLLLESKRGERANQVSVVVFRLGNDWLAVDSHIVREVIPLRTAHRIPHRTTKNMLSLVNYGGMLVLCVNMHAFLGIEEIKALPIHKRGVQSFQRMMAIEKDHNLWIFPIDEAAGVASFDLNQIENVPVTLIKSQVNYLKGIAKWHDRDVGFLDDELLFFGLKAGL